jgi:hypothetical protein
MQRPGRQRTKKGRPVEENQPAHVYSFCIETVSICHVCIFNLLSLANLAKQTVKGIFAGTELGYEEDM